MVQFKLVYPWFSLSWFYTRVLVYPLFSLSWFYTRIWVYPCFSLSWLYTRVWFIQGSVYAGFIQESGLSMVQFKLVLYKSGLFMVQFKLVLYKSLVYPWFSLSWFYTRFWFIHGSV